MTPDCSSSLNFKTNAAQMVLVSTLPVRKYSLAEMDGVTKYIYLLLGLSKVTDFASEILQDWDGLVGFIWQCAITSPLLFHVLYPSWPSSVAFPNRAYRSACGVRGFI